jgi:hypothetical protein
VQDFADAVANRPGWTIENTVALFRQSPDGWSARVSYTRTRGRSYERLHIAIVDLANVARYTTFASTIGEAIRVAEAQVRGRSAQPER